MLTDDALVGRLATEHLIACGRRSIAHLAGPPLLHARRRVEGYRQALAAHGIPPRPDLIVEAGFLEAGGYDAMTRILAAGQGIDAVFGANDPAAIGAMKAIWEAGLRVPQDGAVVGAGNLWHGELLRVPLTTVGWSREELGRRAAALILDQIGPHPDGPFQHIIAPPHLVVRESSGAR